MLKTLRKLRKEAPRKFKDLRIICDELIGNSYNLASLVMPRFVNCCGLLYTVALSDKESANGGQSLDTDADQYFEPLELACQTRQPRLMEIALNAIHYCIGIAFRFHNILSCTL